MPAVCTLELNCTGFIHTRSRVLNITGTGWAQIVLNLRTGEFIPAEPVGFWTSGFRWGLGHGLAESPSKTRSRKSYWCGRKKLARLSVHGPCTGVHLVCSVQLRTLNREFPYIMILGLSVRSRLVHSSPNFDSKIHVLYSV